jgi:hypothetical protein
MLWLLVKEPQHVEISAACYIIPQNLNKQRRVARWHRPGPSPG